MRPLVLVMTTLILVASRAAADEPSPEVSSCTMHCHGEASKAFGESIHARILTCTDCHGGNPRAFRDQAASHDAAAGWRGAVAREDIPALCAECHADPTRMQRYGLSTDQMAHYALSAHGMAVLDDGDTSAAVCTDCHGVHRILRAGDPRSPASPVRQPTTCGRCHSDAAHMEASGLATNAVQRFTASVHGKALLQDLQRAAPTCTSCHGAHGASPPGVDDVAEICGHCHASTREYFETSPHAGNENVQCQACHGAHAISAPGDRMYEGEEPGHCGACHEGEAAVDELIAAIRNGRRSVEAALAETHRLLEDGKQNGLFLENEGEYLRHSAVTLVASRPLTHSLDRAAIEDHFDRGVKRQDRAREALARKSSMLRDRRIVFLGLALLFVLLAALLWLKLQTVRRLS